MAESKHGKRLGRPPGSGALGTDIVHVHVCLPRELYEKLQAFVAGRATRHSGPQMSVCIRTALAHYLSCPETRKPGVPSKAKRQRALVDAL